MKIHPTSVALLVVAVTLSCHLATRASAQTAPGDWPAYGRDAGGSRFSPLSSITPANLASLQPASRAGPAYAGECEVTWPPAIVGGLVIVGSAIADNHRADAPSGVARA